MQETFAGKVCVVTGGATGLGLAIAKRMATYKATVILADIDIVAAENAAKDLREESYHVQALCVDVCDSNSMQELVSKIKQEHKRIDYFINNAGIAILGEIRDLSLEHWKRIINVNLIGTLHGMHFAYPQMLAQKSGHIVNIASGFGIAPGPGNGPYVATKFAVVGLSEVLRAEAKDLGVNVTVVCPGFIETKLVQTAQILKVKTEDFRAQIPVAIVKADKAAEIIVKGLVKKKSRIIFPFYVRILAILYALWPQLYFKFNLLQIRKFRLIRRDNL